MENLFCIRLNNPEYVLPQGKGHHFQSVFSVCFAYPTDNFEIIWDEVTIPFSYKYEVPYVLYPMLEMLKHVSASASGQYEDSIWMDTYRFTWNFVWNKNDLTIDAEWEEMRGLEPIQQLEITVEQFLNESMKLVQLLKQNIKESGVKVGDWYHNGKFLYNLERSVNKRLKRLSRAESN